MSNIKDRVLLIAKEKGILKVDFFKDLDLSYANFKGVQKKSALSSDAVAKILAKYSDISPAWLVSGEGNMLRDKGYDEKLISYGEAILMDEHEQGSVVPGLQRLVSSLEQTIRSQEKTIMALEKQIHFLEAELTRIKGA